jgi:hypothetical protein
LNIVPPGVRLVGRISVSILRDTRPEAGHVRSRAGHRESLVIRRIEPVREARSPRWEHVYRVSFETPAGGGTSWLHTRRALSARDCPFAMTVTTTHDAVEDFTVIPTAAPPPAAPPQGGIPPSSRTPDGPAPLPPLPAPSRLDALDALTVPGDFRVVGTVVAIVHDSDTGLPLWLSIVAGPLPFDVAVADTRGAPVREGDPVRFTVRGLRLWSDAEAS